MTSYFYCLTFSIYCLVLLSSICFTILFMMANSISHIMITLNPMSLNHSNMEMTYLFTESSLIFSMTVLLISTGIYVYSNFYLETCWKSNYYCPLLLTFIASMLYTINCSSLFFIMLGWDGLGFSSYLLVCYYMNSTCLNNGLFTLLTNRLGDIFFIWFITITLTSSTSLQSKLLLAMPLMIGLATKSAIFPFSSWLPAAMSAPTPVSALVHSSTLVTSGLWLMMRNYPYLTMNPKMLEILTVISLFTIFFSGLNTIFELDMKKLIALSTLSHMGFICLGISLGLISLAFLHLLIHAMFKSLLFMAMGMIIISNSHYQDIRYLSCGNKVSNLSTIILMTSTLSLLGIPMMSGFYSKDLMLEASSYSNSSHLMEFLLYCSTLFSFYYSMKLYSFATSNLNSTPYKLYTPLSNCLTLFLLSMMLMNLTLFKYILTLVSLNTLLFPPVTSFNKILLFSLLTTIMLLFYTTTHFYPLNKTGYEFASSMMNLTFVSKNILSTASSKLITQFSSCETMLKKTQLIELEKLNQEMIDKMMSFSSIINLYTMLLFAASVMMVL